MATVEYLKRNGISRAGRVYVVEVRTRVVLDDGFTVTLIGGRFPKRMAIEQAMTLKAKGLGSEGA